MKLVNTTKINNFKLKAFFSFSKIDEDKEELIIKKKFTITEFPDQKIAYIFLDKEADFGICSLKEAVIKIINLNTRNYEIDTKSFICLLKKITESIVVKIFIDKHQYLKGSTLYTLKTTKKEKSVNLTLFSEDINMKKIASDTLFISKSVNDARRLQSIPPNICNSVWLANEMIETLKLHGSKINLKVLNKKEIEKEKMGLLLSVNSGSYFEARLVTAEYIGNPSSKEKTVYIGKGITFDTGGYNLKPSNSIQGMKYDMSGAAICFAAMNSIITLSPKINICIVLPLTDNRISSKGSLPDSIYTSMSGKTVEINNTDAEGRLILADAITYAIRKFNPTRIIDIATLTGAMVVSLGSTYTGVWSTTEKGWEDLLSASKIQNELVWRMPFHNDYLKNMKKSNFADYKNTDLTGKGGSCSAAMFLKEFIEEKEYIHLDIAGTAENNDEPTGVMVKTLIQMAINENN